MFFQITNIKQLFFLIPTILFLHEMEEWNINSFHLNNYSNPIPGETKLSCRVWELFLSLFGFLWTSICYYIPNTTISVLLMMFLIDFTMLNGIQHLFLSLKLKKYNPGLIFGGIVGILLNIVFIKVILEQKVFQTWVLALLLFPIFPFLVESIISSKRNQVPKMLEWILTFSTVLEKEIMK